MKYYYLILMFFITSFSNAQVKAVKVKVIDIIEGVKGKVGGQDAYIFDGVEKYFEFGAIRLVQRVGNKSLVTPIKTSSNQKFYIRLSSLKEHRKKWNEEYNAVVLAGIYAVKLVGHDKGMKAVVMTKHNSKIQ